MSLKSIKGKIRSVAKTRQVAKAMEAVSAVKMRKSQEKALAARPFALSALNVLRRVSGTRAAATHPLLQTRDVKNLLLFVITSDRGLAGALNSSVLKAAARVLLERRLSREEVQVVCVGRKAFEYFNKRGYRIVAHLDSLGDFPSFDPLRAISEDLLTRFLAEEFDEGLLIYTNFLSTFKQEAVVRKILPLSLADVTKVVEGIVPVRGKYADIGKGDTATPAEYTFEPSPESVLSSVLPYFTSIALFHALLESRASEFSARMVAMKSAGDKALEMSRELTLKFNKVRQSAITREVSEIVGGVEAMANA